MDIHIYEDGYKIFSRKVTSQFQFPLLFEGQGTNQNNTTIINTYTPIL